MSDPENQGSRPDPSDALFDITRLRPEERELWDEYCAADWREAPVMAVWSFGQICTLDASGPPDVVIEYMRRHDPDNNIRRYLDNVRQRRHGGRP